MQEEEEQSEVAKREKEILAFWQENDIFKKSLSKNSPKGDFIFYDGPPFATGLPHYGHILAGTIKDAIPRYKTMRGYHVPRRWGWDCHGLPLENQIEKELNLATKRDIEVLGVAKFNEAARNAVLRYADDWKNIIPRFGRWVDMEEGYRTMDASYTESVWWAFGELNKKGLVYEGFKAMHLCPRCGTTLSNFEVAQGYKDITDLSVTVKLELVDEPGTFLLAWTTTPWTLPGNMAAAVHKDETYVRILAKGEKYILAKQRLSVISGEYTIEKEFLGSELVGKSYIPPFPYFKDQNIQGKEKAWKVYHAPYVTMEDGTGLVHLAPAFGAEDLALAQKEGVPIVHHVDKDGFFIDAVSDFKGLQAKPKEDPSNPSGQVSQSTDVAVIKYLAAKGLLFAKEKIIHSYPHCWRCETPLLNYAASSWFVKVTAIKDRLVAENKKIDWVPKEVGEKRFGNWLENARDWAISRARYWGAPIPVWRNPKTKETIFIGSRKELEAHTKRSGNRYFFMRHGQAENNVESIFHLDTHKNGALTEKGKLQIRETATSFKEKIDVVIASPFVRTRQSAEIMAREIGFPVEKIIYDERIREWEVSDEYDGGPLTAVLEYHEFGFIHSPHKKFSNGENFSQLVSRVGSFIYEIEEKYAGKNVLIVSHGGLSQAFMFATEGCNFDMLQRTGPFRLLKNAELVETPFIPFPHNEHYELDYHRPYIDELKLVSADGTELERVRDVFDCWFESGSMSYAQNHYPFDKAQGKPFKTAEGKPFENKNVFDPKPGWFQKSRGYPADFIAEGLDQTRGWFYSLLVLGVGLFGKASYKNVIVNGIVLAEDGQKMSKRLKNYPDPVTVADKYGADALRYYLLASPLMRGEDLSFSEKGVGEVASKLIGRFLNVVAFYELYKDDATESITASNHVLDRWILSRLGQLTTDVEKGMESYELDKATRPFALFVDDLSTWYLRRSRERLKGGGSDTADALRTLRVVIETFAKVSAPFIPFTAEYAYLRVRTKNAPESVHLASWPASEVINEELHTEMEAVRHIASRALEARQKANIKVRQPLSQLTVNSEQLRGKYGLLQLIQDEVNVKSVVSDSTLPKGEVSLNTEITEELQKEGELRNLIREIQELRKQANLQPKEKVILVVPPEHLVLVENNWAEIARVTNLAGKEVGTHLNVHTS